MCSAILKHPDCKNELLGFEREPFLSVDRTTVVYVDTERNLKDQYPAALQSIQVKAGYDIATEPDNFKYISLLPITREDRFAALKEYVDHLRISSNSHLFIVLDVCTDCIGDFNNSDKSMALIDLMNIAVNESNVTFLCLIHENPKTDKARGHLGTEIMNKASTVIQVSYEKEGDDKNRNLICVKYLKCRNTQKHTPFYSKYSQEKHGLILATNLEVSDAINSRKQKATIEDVAGQITEYLSNGIEVKKNDLYKKLMLYFGASERTIDERVKELLEIGHKFTDNDGSKCILKKGKIGKEACFLLEKVLL